MILTDDSYDILAEQTINELLQIRDKRGREIPIVTTSKIRNLLAMTADIYNDVMHIKGEKLPADITGRIRYLKLRIWLKKEEYWNVWMRLKTVSSSLYCSADMWKHWWHSGNLKEKEMSREEKI